MKPLLILALLIFMAYVAYLIRLADVPFVKPENCSSLTARAKQLDRDIVKLKQDISKLDIMQGSTAEFIARVDKMARESERKRK